MVKVVVKRQIGADLGHFGPVRVGDVLQMTDHEWSCVANDKRFVRLNGPPPKQTGPQTSAEKGRLERLAVQNDESRVLKNELLESNRQQLLVKAHAMRDKGSPIIFREPDSCQTLRKAIFEVSTPKTEAHPVEGKSINSDNSQKAEIVDR